MKHFYAIDTVEGNGWTDLDGQLDPTPFPPERFVVQPIPEEDKEMASKMIPFTLDNFIKGKDENGKYHRCDERRSNHKDETPRHEGHHRGA
jgi:hypothetical protein